jgi:hypothetical protein
MRLPTVCRMICNATAIYGCLLTCDEGLLDLQQQRRYKALPGVTRPTERPSSVVLMASEQTAGSTVGGGGSTIGGGGLTIGGLPPNRGNIGGRAGEFIASFSLNTIFPLAVTFSRERRDPEHHTLQTNTCQICSGGGPFICIAGKPAAQKTCIIVPRLKVR